MQNQQIKQSCEVRVMLLSGDRTTIVSSEHPFLYNLTEQLDQTHAKLGTHETSYSVGTLKTLVHIFFSLYFRVRHIKGYIIH